MRSAEFYTVVSVFAVSIVAAVGLQAIASSTVSAIQLNGQVQDDWQFEATRLHKTPYTEFNIETAAKNKPLRSDFTATLSTVQIEENSTEIKGVRKISCDTHQTIVCAFTVSDTALQNPDLGFVLDFQVFSNVNGQKMPMPSASFLYLKLKDIPPQLSAWDKLWSNITTFAKQLRNED